MFPFKIFPQLDRTNVQLQTHLELTDTPGAHSSPSQGWAATPWYRRSSSVPILQKHEVRTGNLLCCTTAGSGSCPAALPLQSMLQGKMHQGMSPRVTPAGVLPRFLKYINGKRQSRNNISGFQDGDDGVPSQTGTWTWRRC